MPKCIENRISGGTFDFGGILQGFRRGRVPARNLDFRVFSDDFSMSISKFELKGSKTASRARCHSSTLGVLELKASLAARGDSPKQPKLTI